MRFVAQLPDKRVELDIIHHEALIVVLAHANGHGLLMRQRLTEKLVEHGIDPDDPGFAAGLKRLRLRRSIKPMMAGRIQLTLEGTALALLIERCIATQSVRRPLPAIEALAAVIRLEQGLHVAAGELPEAHIAGGRTMDELRAAHAKQNPDCTLDESLSYTIGVRMGFWYGGLFYVLHPTDDCSAHHESDHETREAS